MFPCAATVCAADTDDSPKPTAMIAASTPVLSRFKISSLAVISVIERGRDLAACTVSIWVTGRSPRGRPLATTQK